jgi:hypothetical protein
VREVDIGCNVNNIPAFSRVRVSAVRDKFHNECLEHTIYYQCE